MALTFDKATIERLNKSSFSDGNRVALLYKEKRSFDAIFDAIHQAKQFVCLQFYIFRNDETGMEMAAILRKKAKKGVRIYILYDHFGSLWTPKDFWDSLKSSGIEIRVSRPFHWSSPFYYVHRDHRKLIIIDGVKAFTGGLNIANEYRGFHLRSRKKGWRDTGIMVEGPVVSELFRTFRMAWQRRKEPPLSFREVSFERQSNIREVNGLSAIPIFASSAKGRRKMRKLLYYSINHAKESILLTTAYFTPSRRMLAALEEAVERGVTVKLLLPGISDVHAALYAGRAFYTRLLRRGVKIYNYQGEVLHAKSYVFDGCWSIVGSANLDFLSLRWNDEGNVGILDAGFGKRMICVFEEDLKHSVEIREEGWLKRPWSERIQERVFALFRRRL
ncbi:MAG: cardiolipin synthase B [Nitrospirae bacterium]|nr:cardiolipin synthase B [Nitrospirota bacterium]